MAIISLVLNSLGLTYSRIVLLDAKVRFLLILLSVLANFILYLSIFPIYPAPKIALSCFNPSHFYLLSPCPPVPDGLMISRKFHRNIEFYRKLWCQGQPGQFSLSLYQCRLYIATALRLAIQPLLKNFSQLHSKYILK